MLDTMGSGRLTAGEARARTSATLGDDKNVTAAAARKVLVRGDGLLQANLPRNDRGRMKGPVELSFLLSLHPTLATALAEGYAIHCLRTLKSPDGRYNLARALENGFCAFLAEPDTPAVTLADVDETLLHRFIGWLDDPHREGHLTNKQSRSILLAGIQLPLARLLKSREWSPRLSPRLTLIANPYGKMSRETEHNPPLLEPDYEKMFSGAANDIAGTMSKRKAQWAAMAALDPRPRSMTQAGLSPEACAAWLESTFGNPVPSYYEMGRKDADYPRRVKRHIHEEAERILYPDLDEIVPMLLVVCAFFALNPSLAFKLEKHGRDYRIDRFGALERLRMYPHKARASLRQRNVHTVTNHPDDPGQILNYLEQRTERLGDMRPDIGKRVFAAFSWKARRAFALDASDREWRKAIRRFADRHKIPPFTLDQLRPSTLDLVHELSGGNIIAMQGLATHTSAQTTYTFYTTAAQRLRNRERLGELLMQQERWVAMGGKLRPEDRPNDLAEHAAATPGFSCLDPKDSPIPGEQPGELCAAYGRCPECPLAMVDPTSPRALAYLLMLNKRITEAAATMDPLAWHPRWGPVQEELTIYWLRGWDKAVQDKARNIPIPELPPVE